jgi:hypothetical protein
MEKQLSLRNHVSEAEASSATMNWMSNNRRNRARAKAATPRGVKGSAKAEAETLIQATNLHK